MLAAAGACRASALASLLLLLLVVQLRGMELSHKQADQLEGPDPSRALDRSQQREMLDKLAQLLGIGLVAAEDDGAAGGTPPQFMTELYHTVTDSGGKTHASNPYGAKVVRSFIEKDTSFVNVFLFNVSSLEQDESILQAELHLYRKSPPLKLTHPSVLSSPYYLIKVYQILPGENLEEPDLHRLLNVHYVGAYASGWQVFNVKPAVLSWLSGSANLGLLVSATTIFAEPVTVEFSRRDEQPLDKQPILVLFNQQDENSIGTPEAQQLEQLAEEESLLERRRLRRLAQSQPEQIDQYAPLHLPPYFRREKRPRDQVLSDPNDTLPTRKKHGDSLSSRSSLVPRRKSLEKTLSSMDIYERAVLREKLKDARVGDEQGKEAAEPRAKRQSAGGTTCDTAEAEPCARSELYVNFRDIGLTNIIAPDGYSAYQCRGHCKSPLSQDQKPTNHATIQGIINNMNLAPDQDVKTPCCVPVNLSSISILYRDNETDGVVLKPYTDMTVVSCGCR